ncbi:hypothetical protein [Sphingomonas sp. Leaf257]|uniref:hypothetical protein n=1 Tax=Sphingomonas sp. Leaf257 TaxID=1736309 RepID=UPI0014448498|nr:hypothetical protein [Sphingomonas sp. Leaf257]
MGDYTINLEEAAARTAILGVAALARELEAAGALDTAATKRVGQIMLQYVDVVAPAIHDGEHLRGWVAMHLNQGI